jgi:hypothetical protein
LSDRVTALWPTSVKFQMLVRANVIQLMDLFYDLLIQWQDIGGLDVCRFVFLEKEQLVSCHQKGFEDRLLSRVEWRGTVRRIRHRGSRSWKVAVLRGVDDVCCSIILIGYLTKRVILAAGGVVQAL